MHDNGINIIRNHQNLVHGRRTSFHARKNPAENYYRRQFLPRPSSHRRRDRQSQYHSDAQGPYLPRPAPLDASAGTSKLTNTTTTN